MTRIPQAPLPAGDRASITWTVGSPPGQHQSAGRARMRVILDNDFSGDPDDLFQLVHHLLSPSVDVRLIVASHLRSDDPFDPSSTTAANAAAVVASLFERMGLESADLVVPGAEVALDDGRTPQPSPAVARIIAEALRDDTSAPLFYLAGGGLTDIASAYLVEPRIAEKMTLVWIGGAEHDGLADPPPDAMPIEYNLLIDLIAAQVVFGDSSFPIWQVPRDVYRQCLVSDAELRMRVATCGPLGRYLYEEVALVMAAAAEHFGGFAETYALGDSPLVLVTALQSPFEPDSSSSRHVVRPTPEITDDGGYRERANARPMRIYTWVDTRLLFEDFYLKLQEFSGWQTDASNSTHQAEH